MNLSETLKLALSAIWAHKLRSFLTLARNDYRRHGVYGRAVAAAGF
jgi:hypothetical protein